MNPMVDGKITSIIFKQKVYCNNPDGDVCNNAKQFNHSSNKRNNPNIRQMTNARMKKTLMIPAPNARITPMNSMYATTAKKIILSGPS